MFKKTDKKVKEYNNNNKTETGSRPGPIKRNRQKTNSLAYEFVINHQLH